MSRDHAGCTIIWRREMRKIVWLSKSAESDSGAGDSAEYIIRNSDTNGAIKEHEFINEITNDEAEKIIRS